MPILSRRRFITGLCLAAAIPVLEACRQAPPAAPTAAVSPTSAPTTAPLSGATTAAPVASKGVEIEVATRGGTDGDIMENSVKTFL